MPLGHPKNHRSFVSSSLTSQQAESKVDKSPKRPAKGKLVTHRTQPRATSTNHVPHFSIFQLLKAKLAPSEPISWACP